ncbi:MAG TPA: AraC family transcriptional regulator [Clostridiales bacterium]|nr:AraC family transcriptional regulator [Clostridiales bacterium]
MGVLEYQEKVARGSFDFPIEFYYLDAHHPRFRMPTHWHKEYEIIHIVKGGFSFDIGAESGQARAGDTLFVGSGLFHAGIPQDERCVYACVVFDLSQMTGGNKILASVVSGDITVSTRLPGGNSELAGIMQKLQDALSGQEPGFELNVQGLLYQLFSVIVRRRCYKRNTSPADGQARLNRLKSALSLIEQEYASPITLEQLARAAQMSPKYFCHFFKQMTQYTPIEYLNRRRIEAACYRILSGWQSMTELTYECGFSDLSYFIRVFKRIVGVTPKQYALTRRA